jgi:putative NADPH-quinone reductase
VYCHPNSSSFTAAVLDRVLAGLQHSDAEVRVNDLYAEGFDPAFSASDHADNMEPGTDPSIASYGDDLLWCNTLVLVYPTWWAAQPAMLKGWIDRVWVRDVAWKVTGASDSDPNSQSDPDNKSDPGNQSDPDKQGKLRPNLRNIKRIVAVTNHGSPKYVNAVEGESGKRTVTRVLRSMCHPLTRTSWIALYNIDRSTSAQRADFLDRVQTKLTAIAQ